MAFSGAPYAGAPLGGTSSVVDPVVGPELGGGAFGRLILGANPFSGTPGAVTPVGPELGGAGIFGRWILGGNPFSAGPLGAVDAPVVTGGGYHLPQWRRRTRKQVYDERVRLGILPALRKAAKKVAAKAQTVQEFDEDRPKYEALLMRELQVTQWLPDYSSAILIALEIRERDDEDVLFLM